MEKVTAEEHGVNGQWTLEGMGCVLIHQAKGTRKMHGWNSSANEEMKASLEQRSIAVSTASDCGRFSFVAFNRDI
jgi:hypothetical protein